MRYIKKFENSLASLADRNCDSIKLIEFFLEYHHLTQCYFDDFKLDYLSEDRENLYLDIKKLYKIDKTQGIFLIYDVYTDGKLYNTGVSFRLDSLFTNDKDFMDEFIEKLKSLTPEEIEYLKIKDESNKFGL